MEQLKADIKSVAIGGPRLSAQASRPDSTRAGVRYDDGDSGLDHPAMNAKAKTAHIVLHPDRSQFVLASRDNSLLTNDASHFLSTCSQ